MVGRERCRLSLQVAQDGHGYLTGHGAPTYARSLHRSLPSRGDRDCSRRIDHRDRGMRRKFLRGQLTATGRLRRDSPSLPPTRPGARGSLRNLLNRAASSDTNWTIICGSHIPLMWNSPPLYGRVFSPHTPNWLWDVRRLRHGARADREVDAARSSRWAWPNSNWPASRTGWCLARKATRSAC